ncbi:MAG TPA: hypothetical protein PKW66_26215 [Polyangiaceae bacterium]|jgi:hypothetical protein|nr:hypothetical protein [Polyangiaceae bacterium]
MGSLGPALGSKVSEDRFPLHEEPVGSGALLAEPTMKAVVVRRRERGVRGVVRAREMPKEPSTTMNDGAEVEVGAAMVVASRVTQKIVWAAKEVGEAEQHVCPSNAPRLAEALSAKRDDDRPAESRFPCLARAR